MADEHDDTPPCEATLETGTLTYRCEREPGHEGEHRHDLRKWSIVWISESDNRGR